MKKIVFYVFLYLMLFFTNNLYAIDYSKEIDSKTINKYKYNISDTFVNYIDKSIENPNLIQNYGNSQTCWDNAANTYRLDPWLLFAYAYTESKFNPKAINVNKNKSIDIGMMQINTVWRNTLKKNGIELTDLFKPCTSIYIGAWIVAQNLHHFGYNVDGIGAYNSPGNVTIRRKYGNTVIKNYHYLIKKYSKNYS